MPLVTATPDIEYYCEYMRREKGSKRPPLTGEQRRQRRPVHVSVLLTHPVSGRRCVRGVESAELLRAPLDHVMQDEQRSVHQWRVADLLLWDQVGTSHCARPDFGPDEHG
jgi:taurine dioxygenase